MERFLGEIENSQNLVEYRYQLITESMLDIITLIDNKGKIRYASPSYFHALGYKPNNLLDNSFLSFIHPDDHNKIRDAYQEVLNGKISVKLECRFRNANSSYIWLEIAGNVILSGDGQIEGAILCSRDIGERKFAEEMLRNSEKRYRQLVELLPDGILVVCNEKIALANKAAKKILEISKHKGIVGRYYKCIVHSDYAIKVSDINKAENRQVTPLIECKYITDSGGTIDVEIEETPFMYQSQPAQLIVFRDITQRKMVEKNLEEAQKILFEKEKLALIGQMAAGMAHEVRNPLATVRGYAQLLQLKEYNKERLNSYLEIIIKEIDRVNNLISDFLQLARPKEPSLKKQDINQLISEFLELFMSQTLYNNIEVIYEPKNNLPKCYLDEDQIKQVLLNLAKNSIDAMPKGGKLRIATGFNTEERQVFIVIEDNGCGIPESVLSKLTMPFFTTKDKGTGLGLSISYALIRAHGGKIEVESIVKKGTKFTIFLPVE
ncbi:MAG: PAS domain S-box protein [Peptococcales bacterium]